MSYDVEVYGEEFNYTYNMARFFKDFDVYPPSWNGKDRTEVAKQIEAGIARIEAEDFEELAEDYNSENGWGDIHTALQFLRKVKAACEMQYSEIVKVW